MRINLDILKEILPCPTLNQVPSAGQSNITPPTIGLFRAIEAAHESDNSKDVDWNSFSLADAKEALDHAMNYESYEHIEEGTDNVNKDNAIHQYLHSCNLIAELKRSAPENQVSEVQFF